MNVIITKTAQAGEREVLLPPSKRGDVGYDILAVKDTPLPADCITRVKTGLILLFDEDGSMYAEIKERSSIALRGLFVHGGIIDRGYRGEVEVIIHNSNQYGVSLAEGEKIAQLVFRQAITPEVITVQETTLTERGVDGFGSTGR